MNRQAVRTIAVAVLMAGPAIAGWLMVASVPSASAPAVTVDFLDVGQGDATLTQSGSVQMLIDGGPDRLILTRLGRELPFQDRQIEAVVATHPHDDHTVGLEAVLERYQVGRLIIPDVLADHPGWERLLAAAAAQAVPVERVLAGDRLVWGEGLRAEVIWPPPDCPEIVRNQPSHHDVANSCSLVLRLEGQAAVGRPWRVLLMGDATTTTEAELLRQQTVGPVDLLKVGHHGSRYSSSAAYLEAVSPGHSVVSVGQNRFGHPDTGALLRLARFSGAVWRTDRDWGVRATFSDQGLEVTAGHGH